jgi:hypothetical protein
MNLFNQKMSPIKNLSNYFLSILLIIFISTFPRCKSDEENKYQGCCNISSLLETLDTGRIFIPNAFTPNGDGVNDSFFPHTDGGIEAINSFIIKNQNGSIMFSRENLPSNSQLDGWNALDNQNNAIGGLFEYEVTVISVLGESATFTGEVCSYICLESGFPSENIDNCEFGSQHDGIGNLDQSLPSHEEECF